MWFEELSQCGVDVNALNGLSRLEMRDKHAANKVISKFFKKYADHHEIRKPSAFIHSSVRAENVSRGYW